MQELAKSSLCFSNPSRLARHKTQILKQTLYRDPHEAFIQTKQQSHKAGKKNAIEDSGLSSDFVGQRQSSMVAEENVYEGEQSGSEIDPPSSILL